TFSACFGVKRATGRGADLPVGVSILTEYGCRGCCVFGVMRHLLQEHIIAWVAAPVVMQGLLQSLPRRGHMEIIALLKSERDKAARQLSGLDTAIRALSGLNTTRSARGPRRMSAAARAKISASQTARWAKQKGQKVTSVKAGKRRFSPEGIARIRAAARAR